MGRESVLGRHTGAWGPPPSVLTTLVSRQHHGGTVDPADTTCTAGQSGGVIAIVMVEGASSSVVGLGHRLDKFALSPGVASRPMGRFVFSVWLPGDASGHP